MENKKSWDEAFDTSKPLITYSIISGFTLTNIAEIFNEIMLGGDPTEMNIEQVVIDRIPRKDRHDYEFPATAPIFVEGYRVMKENQPPKAVPIVLTNTEAGRRYAIALVFYEDLRDYVRVLRES